MKVLALHPLEYPVSKLSIDTKFMQNGLSSKGVLTSEPVYYSNVCMDAYSPTTTLADQTPPPYYIQAIDINKHRIMHLQRYKHVLRLVMLCTTVCWISLTIVFALLIIRQTSVADQHSSSQSYTVVFSIAIAVLFTIWCISAALCVWQFRKYKRWLNSSHTKTEWVVAGKPTCRISSDMLHV